MSELQRVTEAVPARAVDPRAGRWALIRDLAVFQLKLFVDGLKDLVLSPLSLIAGVLDLVIGGERPGRLFHGVLRTGASFERWVRLFGAAERDATSRDGAGRDGAGRDATADGRREALEAAPERRDGLDAHIAQLERLLVEQHRQGGLTANAKRALDRALDALESSSRVITTRARDDRPAR
ncbi:MAG: hypothetical protein H6713_40130 [Myxococcales bacterium]|nr:hypothetical protein [Myxococcales bacterium]